MKLLRDLLILGLLAFGVYTWKHRPVPQRAPALPGARPNLAMPAPGARPSAEPGSSMLVAPEDAGRPEAHLKGARVQEKALGEKPQLLGTPAVDPTAGNVPDALPDERSPWTDRLRQPWAAAAVVALFIVLYALLTRALRKGPGGQGFTHD